MNQGDRRVLSENIPIFYSLYVSTLRIRGTEIKDILTGIVLLDWSKVPQFFSVGPFCVLVKKIFLSIYKKNVYFSNI